MAKSTRLEVFSAVLQHLTNTREIYSRMPDVRAEEVFLMLYFDQVIVNDGWELVFGAFVSCDILTAISGRNIYILHYLI
jgi:hypothetical protein